MSLTHVTDQREQNASNPDWKYSPVRYWPANDEKLTFIAWAPALATNWTWPASSTTTTITVDEDPTKQIDFIWAIDDNLKKSTHASTGVTLDFKHKMSKIDFTVTTTNEDTETTIVLNEISIGSDTKGFGTTGTVNLLTGEVNAVTTTVRGYTWSGLNVSVNKGSAAKAITAGSELIVCPQTVIDDMPITVKYTTTTDGVATVHTIPVTLDFTPEADKVYSIDLSIGLSAIEISSVGVSGWTSPSVTTPVTVETK